MSWWDDQRPSHRRPAARGRGSRRAFGSTWWGQAWVDALTERARLDPNRLSRGRSYARSGAVGALEVSPGEVRAEVQGSRSRPYTVRVRVREFDPSEWDRLLDAVASRVGHAAAMLEGDLPPEVEGEAAAAGVDLLPGAGELGPQCSCPDWANPCKHAAAVCYLVADRLDSDPFELLHLRGRSREQVLADLRARRGRLGGAQPTTGEPATPTTLDQGVSAAEVFAAWDQRQEDEITPPAIPLPPSRPGRPQLLLADPPSTLGEVAAGLRDDLTALAGDAALRAWALATGDAPEPPGADAETDLARIAASALGTPRFTVLARRSGMGARDLARRAIAWQHGGRSGVDVVLGTQLRPDGDDLERARQSLGAGARVRGGRVTLGDIQLRWGPDEQWYGMRRRHGVWDLAGPPDPDPGIAAGRARGD